MTDISQIDRIFLEGCALKDRAIVSLGDLELYLEAACRFEQAAQIAHAAASEDARDPENSDYLGCLFAYYEYEKHYCLSAYEYEKRNADAARDHVQNGLRALDDAIQRSQSSAFGPEMIQKMQPHVTMWKYFRISHEAQKYAIDARSHWDAGRYIQAVDAYRSAVPLEQRASEFASANNLGQRYIRIARGNVIGMTANASQALAMHTLKQGDSDASQKGVALSKDRAFLLIRFGLDAIEQGKAAYMMNPEWTQYREAAEQCRSNIEQFLKENRKEWVPLYIEFEGDDGLHRIMKNADLNWYKEVVQMVKIPNNKTVKLWAVGSFWLLALAIVTGVVLLIMKQGAGFWTTIIVIVGIEVILTIIGALTLRSTGDVSEGGFISLMSLAFRTQFLVTKLFKTKDSSDSDERPKD